jgi:2-hydroxychromene-2-carboxylate isomerase
MPASAPTPKPSPNVVEFWFDFVSAYSWLGAAQAEAFARENGVRFRLRPFVLGVALERLGRKAVAQVPASRGYAVFDVAREADRLGLRFVGPPEHPFVSLTALRAMVLHQDDERALALCTGLFRACWERGEDLTDAAVVRRIVADAGFDACADDAAFVARIKARETKDLLKHNTEEAIARGVFGAPFFFFDDEPFYGQDRLPQLAERAAGRPRLGADVLAAVARQAGVPIPGRRRDPSGA